ncbi:MAG: lycopene cyclase domain-containing protein [Bacteroidota bacterium]|jgi:lycopene cyclase domain-containing protein
MNTHFTYLILNFSAVFFPLVLSFDQKVAFYKLWKKLFIAIFINSLFFISWDIIFTHKNIWNFNPNYILGIYFFNLPIEEVLFFITVPYSCIFIYEVVKAYSKNQIFKFEKTVIIIFSIICLTTALLYHNKLYTLTNACICLFLIIFATYIYKLKTLNQFFVSYFISLIPFLVCNGILTALPVVVYNNFENMNLRLLSIPLEDLFYCLSLMLLPILIMDFLSRKSIQVISK